MGVGQNPAAKVELGERRIWPWLGRHGESEEEKFEMFCCRWADTGGGLQKRKVKMSTEQRKGRAMALVGEVEPEEVVFDI